jgi:hypothetical protein
MLLVITEQTRQKQLTGLCALLLLLRCCCCMRLGIQASIRDSCHPLYNDVWQDWVNNIYLLSRNNAEKNRLEYSSEGSRVPQYQVGDNRSSIRLANLSQYHYNNQWHFHRHTDHSINCQKLQVGSGQLTIYSIRCGLRLRHEDVVAQWMTQLPHSLLCVVWASGQAGRSAGLVCYRSQGVAS